MASYVQTQRFAVFVV